MVRKREKRKTKARKICDERDAKILAVKAVKPKAKLREISEKTDIPITTVHRRLQGIPETEEYQEAAKECLGLLMDAVKVYRRRIKGKPDPTGIDLRAANQLLNGLGLFRTKHDLELKGNVKHELKGKFYGYVDRLDAVSDADLEREIADLESAAGEASGAAPGVGETVSEDREEPAT